MIRPIAFTAVALILTLGAAPPQTQPDRPLADQPYLGLKVTDYEPAGYPIVHYIFPGPLKGTTYHSPYLDRADLILAVDGKKRTVDEIKKLLEQKKPGDTITLKVQRTGIVRLQGRPKPGPGKEVQEITVRLDSREKWSGPCSYKRPQHQWPDPETVVPRDGPVEFERFIQEQIDSQGLRKPIEKLLLVFADWQNRFNGPNLLTRVAYVFARPMRLVSLYRVITDPIAKITGDPRLLFHIAADNLDLRRPVLSEPFDVSDPKLAVETVAVQFTAATALVNEAFAQIDNEDLADMPRTFDTMIAGLGQGAGIMKHEDPAWELRALRASMKVDFDGLFNAAGALAGFLQPSKPPAESSPTVPLPEGLKDCVTGEILAAWNVANDWIVYGGFGENSYDMSKLAVVLDAGGDDTYTYPVLYRRAVQMIIDFAGDDRYFADHAGPASGLMGIDLVVDYAGDDEYRGQARSCGVGVMGVGVLLDRAGRDKYSGTCWSQGAAMYGTGAIIDLGGPDVYWAEVMSQGIGGPRGFGLILDKSGRDLYRANGPVEAINEPPGVFIGLSQGVGLGLRHYDTGGIGVIEDLSGNDRYEVAAHGQGGAYFYGLGILHDHAGNDVYHSSHYGQGYGCHQAHGILVDDGGDDTYYGLTSALQGASWDVGVGVLLDRKGNDSYYGGDGLSQGAASMQAVAWLIDLDGQDHYVSRGAAHGRSSGNNYHYDTTKAFSFSMFLDAGGSEDFYSTGRKNGYTLTPGAFNEKSPGHSALHGLFIDSAKKLSFPKNDPKTQPITAAENR